MITKLNISGFKSLVNFEIDFTNGLNVMIGPNGSGKTTICQAMGILAALADGRIEEYLLSIGGTGGIFTKTPDSEYEDGLDLEEIVLETVSRVSEYNVKVEETEKIIEILDEIYEELSNSKVKDVALYRDDNELMKDVITVYCEGTTDSRHGDKVVAVRYEYSFMIIVDEQLEILNEKLVASVRNAKSGRFKQVFVADSFDDGMMRVVIKDRKLVGHTSLPKTNAKTYYFERGFLRKSVLDCVAHAFFYGYSISKDMAMITVYNIDPSIAKKSSDLLDPPLMGSEGKNLANNICYFKDEIEENAIELNAFINSINPRFVEVKSVPDDGNGKRRSFSIVDADGVDVSAESLSDGTVKSIALYVAMLNSNIGNAIFEEPENYIHPWVCRSFIDHIREDMQGRTCIITTHSETILNMVDPEEIIVCENIDGFTKVRRIGEEEGIASAVKMSGFGCGYHYVSGALGGTPEW